MPDINVEIDIDLECSECGESLTASASTRGQQPIFTVDPCRKCIGTAEETAEDEGYQRGLDEGRAEGAAD